MLTDSDALNRFKTAREQYQACRAAVYSITGLDRLGIYDEAGNVTPETVRRVRKTLERRVFALAHPYEAFQEGADHGNDK